MRRHLFILPASVLAVSATLIFIKPAIIFIAVRQIKATFKGSVVSISSCNWQPLKALEFSGIKIQRDNIYEFKVKQASINYSPISLLKMTIDKFSLADIQVSIRLPKAKYSEFMQYLNLRPRAVFSLNSAAISNLNLDLESSDLTVRAGLSLELSPASQTLTLLEASLSSLRVSGLIVQDAGLKVAQGDEPGDFYVDKLQYGKAKITEIKARPKLKGKNLFLDSFSAKALNGEVTGDLSLNMDQDYAFDLRFLNLDLERFVNDFNLNEKLQLSGKLNGRVHLSGSGLKIKSLSGDFSSIEPGGLMVIKDAGFLESAAQRSGQSLDILMESFKDYHYNTGVMKLSRQKDGIGLDIALEGEAGKRNLDIVVHTLR